METEEQMIIRLADVRDADEMLEIYAPYVEQTAVTFEYEVPAVEDFAKRVARVQQRYPWLVAEQADEIIGYAYASAFHERPAYDWSAEVSVYVRQDCRGLGVGKSLYQMLEQMLTLQGILNMNACIACGEAEDEHLTDSSLRFHEKMGFSLVGRFHQCGYKFRRWYDVVWMEKAIGDHSVPAEPVKLFSGDML